MPAIRIVLCILSLAQASRSRYETLSNKEARSSPANAHDASSQPTDPCQKANLREPAMGTMTIRTRLLDQDQINWLDCEAQKVANKKRDKHLKAGRALMTNHDMTELDKGNTPWGKFTMEGGRVANAAKAAKAERELQRRIKIDTVAGVAKAVVDIVKEPFVSFFRELAASASSASDAVCKAIYLLLRVPNLTKQQYLKVEQAVQAEWPGIQYMLLNYIANGHDGSPGVGRATVTPKRRAYLETLRTLDPVHPGSRFMTVPGMRENMRLETEECAGYGRLCGKDGGLGCCRLSGSCTEMTRIKNTVVQNLHVCQ